MRIPEASRAMYPPKTGETLNYGAQGQSGFTLFELLMTTVVFAILMAVAVPAMSEFVTNQRTTRSANQLLADLALARTQALVLQRPVRVGASGANWQDGWIVASDANADGVIDGGVRPDEQFRQQEALPQDFGLSLTEGGGVNWTNIWFDRLGAAMVQLPGNNSVNYPLRFLVERPDMDPAKASTICVASSGIAYVRKGIAAC